MTLQRSCGAERVKDTKELETSNTLNFLDVNPFSTKPIFGTNRKERKKKKRFSGNFIASTLGFTLEREIWSRSLSLTMIPFLFPFSR